MFNDLSLKKRIIAVNIFIIFLTSIVWIVSAIRLGISIRENTEVNTLLDESRLANADLGKAMEDKVSLMGSLLQGIITRDEANKELPLRNEQIERSLKKIDSSLGTLSTFQDITDFKPKKNISDVRDSITLLSEVEEQVLSLSVNNNSATDSASVKPAIAAVYQARASLGSVKQLAVTQSNIEKAVVKRQTDSLRNNILLTAGIACIFIALSIVIATKTGQYVSKSFASFKKDAQDVVSGDFNKVIEHPARNEIGELAEIFNKMTELLKQSYDLIENKVKERTAELENIKIELEKTVSSQAAQSDEKIKELETLNKAMIGRELTMAHLKQEIEALKAKLAKYEKPISPAVPPEPAEKTPTPPAVS